MQLGQITRNQIIGLIMFLEVVVIGLVVWFVLIPKNNAIKELDVVIQQKTEKVRQVETTKKELKELKIEVSELKADLSRLEQHFKKELFLPRTLPLLEKLADRTKITLVGMKPVTEKAKKPGAGKPNASAAAAAAAPAEGEGEGKGAKPPAKQGFQNKQAAAPGAEVKSKKTFSEGQEFEKTIIEVQYMGTFAAIVSFINELSTFPKLVVVDRIELKMERKVSSATKGVKETHTDLIMAKMPMTFYIQKQQSLVTLSGEEKSAGASEQQPVKPQKKPYSPGGGAKKQP